jgi:hypothetical protein
MKGEPVSFIAGGPDSGLTVRGRLLEIGAEGELLLLPDGEDKPRSFVTGELRVYG